MTEISTTVPRIARKEKLVKDIVGERRKIQELFKDIREYESSILQNRHLAMAHFGAFEKTLARARLGVGTLLILLRELAKTGVVRDAIEATREAVGEARTRTETKLSQIGKLEKARELGERFGGVMGRADEKRARQANSLYKKLMLLIHPDRVRPGSELAAALARDVLLKKEIDQLNEEARQAKLCADVSLLRSLIVVAEDLVGKYSGSDRDREIRIDGEDEGEDPERQLARLEGELKSIRLVVESMRLRIGELHDDPYGRLNLMDAQSIEDLKAVYKKRAEAADRMRVRLLSFAEAKYGPEASRSLDFYVSETVGRMS